jgi:hypothetical protein
MRCLAPVVTVSAALALTGCAASATQSAAGNSPPAVAAPAASHAGTSADVQVCKRLKAFPRSTTVAGAKKYVTFLVRQDKLRGVSLALSGQLEAAATDLTSYLTGIGSQQQVGADANKLQSICNDYGVTG